MDKEINYENAPLDARGKILRLKTLSVIPGAGNRVLRLLENKGSGPDAVAREIEQLPELCARIIGIANSAFFGRTKRVHRISDAVIVIGTNLVKQLALTMTLSSSFDTRKCLAFDVREYWCHSIVSAMLASALSKHCKITSGVIEYAYLCGLLHSIGLPVMAHLFPVEMSEVLVRSAECGEENICAIERDILDIDHHIAGAWVMRRWGLPDEVVTVVEHYVDANYRGPHRELCQLVRHCSASSCEIMRKNEVIDIDEESVSSLGIDIGKVREIYLEYSEKRESFIEMSRIIASE